MSLTKFIRDIQSKFEAIPAPAAYFYDFLPARILRKPENKIVEDVVKEIKNYNIILDIGSGTGYLSIEIAKRLPFVEVYGIDLGKKMVETSRHHAKGLKNVHFEFANAAKLPFKDNSIDFIISTGSLHHWKYPEKVFNECWRVLKDEREAWIYDPCVDALKNDIDKARKEYGVLGYRIFTKVTQLHGFSKTEYETEIKGILDKTKFSNNYKMELTDIWMKVILKKHR
jgi:ubiquinone/menaquinone biosynthesis C-methylase UbiE